MRPNATICALIIALLVGSGTAAAQESEPATASPTIAATAELTAVWAGGNADASTFGAAAGVRFGWPRSELKFDAGGIRTESVLTTRRAVGSELAFDIDESSDRQRTAENYYARSRFDHKLSDLFLVFAGLDWLRNTFSGIDSRFLVAAGAGNTWIDNERMRLKTDYGVTYTFQSDVVTNPFTSSSFPGIRAAYDLWHRVSGTTELVSTLVADLNLDNTDDIRLNFAAALPVSISSRLALKPSIQLLWQNDPALKEVPLFASAQESEPQIGTVVVPLDKLDTFFTLAIVVKL